MSLSAELENFLDGEWGKHTESLGFLFSSRVFLEVLDERKKENPITISDEAFDAWSRIVQEQLCWMFLLQQKLFHLVSKDDEKKEPLLLALWCLVSKICSDIFALRSLISNGFEVQSRLILRSTIEYIDLAIAICHDRELASEFMLANDEVKANTFWFRYISKGKLRRRVSVIVDDYFGVSGADFLARVRADDDEMHSAFSHPTSLAGLIASAGDLEVEPKYDGVLGVPTRASTASLRYLSTHIFHFVNTCCEGLFLPSGAEMCVIEYDLTNKKDYLIRVGWVRLMFIFKWILDRGLYLAVDPGKET